MAVWDSGTRHSRGLSAAPIYPGATESGCLGLGDSPQSIQERRKVAVWDSPLLAMWRMRRRRAADVYGVPGTRDSYSHW